MLDFTSQRIIATSLVALSVLIPAVPCVYALEGEGNRFVILPLEPATSVVEAPLLPKPEEPVVTKPTVKPSTLRAAPPALAAPMPAPKKVRSIPRIGTAVPMMPSPGNVLPATQLPYLLSSIFSNKRIIETAQQYQRSLTEWILSRQNNTTTTPDQLDHQSLVYIGITVVVLLVLLAILLIVILFRL